MSTDAGDRLGIWWKGNERLPDTGLPPFWSRLQTWAVSQH
jgi:hypothetical protein